MSGIFGGLKQQTQGVEKSDDRLGGFRPFDQNAYTGPIKMAYADQAASGAKNVTVIIELDGREYEETIYYTDRDGKTYYIDKQDKTKKRELPGFTVLNDLCLVATGAELADQDEHVEEKLVKVYDKDAKARIPKNKPVITSLIGKEVTVTIEATLVNKQAKNDQGKYVDVAGDRIENSIHTVFDPESKLSVAEARNERPAEFQDAWVKLNKGKTQDKRTIKDGQGGGGNAGAPPANRSAGAPPAAGGAAAPAKRNLFGPKAA